MEGNATEGQPKHGAGALAAQAGTTHNIRALPYPISPPTGPARSMHEPFHHLRRLIVRLRAAVVVLVSLPLALGCGADSPRDHDRDTLRILYFGDEWVFSPNWDVNAKFALFPAILALRLTPCFPGDPPSTMCALSPFLIGASSRMARTRGR